MTGQRPVATGAGLRWRSEPRPADVEAVRGLVDETGVFSAAEVAIAAELVGEALRAGTAASGYAFIFAERADRLAGYSCFGPIPATAASFDLYWIAVRSGERGHGLGRALLARSEACVVKMGGLRMYVDTSSRNEHAPAHALYQSAGYREVARLEDFYAPGDAKLIFEKRLANAGSRVG